MSYLPDITEDMSEDEKLGKILDQTLEIAASVDPALSAALLYCAVPHWFDAEIIGWMRKAGPMTNLPDEAILKEVESYPLVRRHPIQGYAYHEDVRRYFLAKLRLENPEQLLQYTKQASAYFDYKIGQVSEQQKPEYERERMYHLLVLDEEAGLELLNELYRAAESRYQLSICHLLIQLAEERQDHMRGRGRLWLRYYEARLKQRYGQREDAARLYGELLDSGIRDERLKAYINNDLGSILLHRGKWLEAEQHFKQNLEICRQLGLQRDEAVTLGNLGLVDMSQGMLESAAQYRQEALMVYREIGDRSGEATALGNLGQIYALQKRWAEARQYLQQSLAVFQELGNRYREGRVLFAIGGLYYRQRNFSKAAQYWETSASISQELGDPVGSVTALAHLASVHLRQGKIKEANLFYEELFSMCHEQGDRLGEGHTPLYVFVYLSQRKWIKAFKCLIEVALAMSRGRPLIEFPP